MTLLQKIKHELMILIDKSVINYRAVDDGHITPQQRDTMNTKLENNFLNYVLETLNVKDVNIK